VESFPFVQKELWLRMPNRETERVRLAGTATVEIGTDATGQAADTDGDGLDQVPIELIALNLVGNSSLGLVMVTVDPTKQSTGQIEEQTNLTPAQLDIAPLTPGVDNDCDSFFDIWVEISVDGQTLHSETAEHVSAVISHLPPEPGEVYTTPLDMFPIPLVDYDGQSTGYSIVSQRIDLNPEREVDHFPFVQKELVLRLATGATERVLLAGTMTMEVGIDPSGAAVDTTGTAATRCRRC